MIQAFKGGFVESTVTCQGMRNSLLFLLPDRRRSAKARDFIRVAR